MLDELVNLNHLKQGLIASKNLTAQVATNCADAVEELAQNMITMEQVNNAIDDAIGNALKEVY